MDNTTWTQYLIYVLGKKTEDHIKLREVQGDPEELEEGVESGYDQNALSCVKFSKKTFCS